MAEQPIDQVIVVHVGYARTIGGRQPGAVRVGAVGNAEELARRIERPGVGVAARVERLRVVHDDAARMRRGERRRRLPFQTEVVHIQQTLALRRRARRKRRIEPLVDVIEGRRNAGALERRERGVAHVERHPSARRTDDAQNLGEACASARQRDGIPVIRRAAADLELEEPADSLGARAHVRSHAVRKVLTIAGWLNIRTSMIDSHGTNGSPNWRYSTARGWTNCSAIPPAAKRSREYSSRPPGTLR